MVAWEGLGVGRGLAKVIVVGAGRKMNRCRTQVNRNPVIINSVVAITGVFYHKLEFQIVTNTWELQNKVRHQVSQQLLR